MTSTTAEVEVIDFAPAEIEVINAEALLSTSEAKALDKKIRATTTKVNDNMSLLFDLMEQAVEGEIHKPLGYASISDYFSEAVDIAPSSASERKIMATLMSGKGLSQRAIASALNVSVGTVKSDLSDAEKGATVSPDGRTFTPREVEEEEEDATEDHGQAKALVKAQRAVQSAAEALQEAFANGNHFDHDVNPTLIRNSIRDIKAAWSECLDVFKKVGAIK